ncbi:MAG: hypothetical protein RIT27_1028 [Pseudomonadota bacterium]|jgi:NitT/TauT family transport system substrate-binding protein
MRWKQYFLIWSCLLLVACFEAPQEMLRIGTNRWVGYEPLYLARDLNYFKSNQVRLVEYPSATEVIAAFRNNLLEGAALTLDEAISLLATVPDARVILICDISNGGDAIISQPHLNTLEQLKGKRIGVENTAVGGFLLQSALNNVGLSIRDIIAVSLTMDKHEAAFISKKIDAAVTFEPTRSRLIEQGGINLFDSRQLTIPIIDVLIVRANVLEEQRNMWKLIIQGWFQAVDYIKQHEKEAVKYISVRMGGSPEMISSMLKNVVFPTVAQNHDFLGGYTPKLRENAENLLDWMITNGFLSQNISNRAIVALPTPQVLPILNP